MMAFVWRMWRDKWLLFAGYTVVTIGLIETYVALFPSIKTMSSGFDQMLESMPPAFLKAFGMDQATFSFGTFQGYMSTEYLTFLWPIIAIAFAISLANYISVREVDGGTVETLLSLPVRRSRIFVERYIAGLVMVILFSGVSLLAALPLAQAHGISYKTDNFVTAAVGATLFSTCVYTLAAWVSVLVSARGKATLITSSILIVMYILNVVATLNTHVTNLRYASIFYYFNGAELLANNHYPGYMFMAFGGTTIVLLALAIWRYTRRDFSA